MKLIFSLLLLALLSITSTSIFAAKAVCTVKNIQSGQVFTAIKGKRSYSVAKNESKRQALLTCIYNSRQAKYCQLKTCYQR